MARPATFQHDRDIMGAISLDDDVLEMFRSGTCLNVEKKRGKKVGIDAWYRAEGREFFWKIIL